MHRKLQRLATLRRSERFGMELAKLRVARCGKALGLLYAATISAQNRPIASAHLETSALTAEAPAHMLAAVVVGRVGP